MMYRFFFLTVLMFATTLLSAQTAEGDPPVIDLETQQKISVTGDLKTGMLMPLDWAASSQMACFPATRFNEYQGKHILYRVVMPAQSEMKITLTPKSKKNRINLYALRLGIDNQGVPPNLPSAISCEAAYPIYAGKPNYKKAATPKSIDFISIRKPYTMVIGVAGGVGTIEGGFELDITIDKR